MKILYIANIRIPTEKAHGIQIMKMCQAFSNAGHNLTLIIPARKNKIKEDVWKYYDQEKNFEIEYLKIIDFMRLDIPIISFYLQTRNFLKVVKKYLKKEKVDLIYSRDLSIIKNLNFKNIFFEMHSLPRSFKKYDLKKIKGIITITQALKDSLVEKGISEEIIFVSSDGVDLEQFNLNISKKEARSKLNLPKDKKIVLYNGHLYKWKGAQILADASKFLNDDTLIIFTGGTKEDVKKFKNINSKFENVIVLGHKPYSEIPYYLKSVDVLVLPNSSKENISKLWTSPMKMFEYMTSKRPIVASNLISIREVLNKNNSILIKPNDPEDLALGIKKALNNDNISKKAFEDVQEYTWNKRVRKILDFINE